MSKYEEYPKWKYHATGHALIVKDEATEKALGPLWVDSPAYLTNGAEKPPAKVLRIKPEKKSEDNH